MTTLRFRDIEETIGKKCITAKEKFFIFLNFLGRERSSGLEFWEASGGLNYPH